MMLEAGSSPRAKNRSGLKPIQLVDPTNTELRDVLDKFEQGEMGDAADFVSGGDIVGTSKGSAAVEDDDDDDDAEFSGSDDEERAEWERRRKEKQGR